MHTAENTSDEKEHLHL